MDFKFTRAADEKPLRYLSWDANKLRTSNNGSNAKHILFNILSSKYKTYVIQNKNTLSGVLTKKKRQNFVLSPASSLSNICTYKERFFGSKEDKTRKTERNGRSFSNTKIRNKNFETDRYLYQEGSLRRAKDPVEETKDELESYPNDL